MTDWNASPPQGPRETFRADLPRAKAQKLGKPAKPGKPRKPVGPISKVWLILAGLVVTLLAGALNGYIYGRRIYLSDLPEIPPREQLYVLNRAPSIRFFDRNGTLIAARGPKNGDRVSLEHLPAHVPLAFLAAEDRRFYRHGPIDTIGIVRAAYVNWQAKDVVQGGSTLSQQLAKSLFLTPDQTLKRKIQEAVLAQKLERMLTKDEVLELYLNRTYFGANTFGVDGASRTYFGKPAGQLSISEAALLAALPKAPSRLSLHHNMADALDRQRLILANMRAEGWITPEQETAALASPPKLTAIALANDGDMGYVLDFATSEVLRRVGPNSPDLMVRLTIDPNLQAAGADVLRSVVAAGGGPSQGALVAMSADGAIRTMVGGVDYSSSVFNRAVQARRQPGSSFKPFVYAAALEKGLLPTDTRVDGPIRLGNWSPKNYGGGYRGTVTLETALAQSINTVAVKLAQEVGGRAIANLAHRFGLTSIPDNPSLAVALGAYEVPLIDMVAGFQVFQNQGQRTTPYVVSEIRSLNGTEIYRQITASPLPVYDMPHAGMMVRMMQRVIRSGTGTRANFGRPAAGKTGTSQNWRDAWFVGFTPDYVAGVWVGNDDDRPMNHVTGGVMAAEIWRRFMIAAHDKLPVRDFDWLLPEAPLEIIYQTDEPRAERDHRSRFYDDLSSDFAAHDPEAPPPEEEPTPEPEPELPPVEDAPY